MIKLSNAKWSTDRKGRRDSHQMIDQPINCWSNQVINCIRWSSDELKKCSSEVMKWSNDQVFNLSNTKIKIDGQIKLSNN